MIRLATDKDTPLVEKLAKNTPVLGARLWVDWALLADNQAMPYRFYVVDEAALLEASGGTGVLCGPVAAEDEILAFLDFLGIADFSGNCWRPPGWLTQSLVLMQRQNAPTQAGICAGVEAEPPASQVLQVLQSGKEMPQNVWDGLYADLCARRNRGLAQVAGLRAGEELVSTAGLYCLTPWEGYLAGVATKPAARGKGYAAQLIQWLCAQHQGLPIHLLCAQAMQPYYSKLGFVPKGQILRCARPLEETGIND